MEGKSWRAPLFICAFAAVLLGLVWGAGFLIPLVIAVFVWNILSAIIEAFERMHFPRWLASIISITLVVLVCTFVFQVIASQIDAVVVSWPYYVRRVETLLAEAAMAVGPDIASKVREALSHFDFSSGIGRILGSAQSFLVSLGLVLIYCAFLFVEARHAPAKIHSIVGGANNKDDVEEILASMSTSLRRYFGVKTVLSILTALGSYAILEMLGLDFAETWAFLVFLLNFIPNVGPTIAVALPALLALIQFDQLWPFAIISIGLTVIQVVVGNIIEPMFLGRTLNVSPFVVIVSLVFWGTIWGVVGMFLAVPITVFVLIVGQYMPRWRWVAVLLSKEGKLSV